jgi:hypothetical protein
MTQHRATHEDLSRRHEERPGSDRSFGFVFAAVFGVIALIPLLSGAGIRVWALAPAAAFLGLALLRPAALAPLNQAWLVFGRRLHRLVSPVVLGFLFYAVITPAGLLLRALGKDPLRLSLKPDAATYWIERQPGPDPETMRNQF